MGITIFSAEQAVITEGTTASYVCTLVDEHEVPIEPGGVSAMYVTLVNAETGLAINSRSRQTCLNANGGTLSAGGAFTLELTPLDTIAIGARTVQKRRLTFEVDYGASKQLTHEVTFYVRALPDFS